MLSVMTMAWRDAPAETTAPFATGQSQEERRRQLFDAYVQAALHRRGKASSGYTPDQTIHWLSWLARRMKEHGLTLFSVEQLQPGWLAGVRSQVGYMIVTRLLGCCAVAVPILCSQMPVTSRLACSLLAVMVGLAYGGIDAFMLQKDLRVGDSGSRRFWLMVLTTLGLGAAWIWVALMMQASRVDLMLGPGLLYLAMVAFSFVAPVDVRTLDIKPSDTMLWSTPQAVERFGVAMVGFNLLIFIVVGGGIVVMLVSGSGSEVARMFGDLWFSAGLLLGAVAGSMVGRRIWPRGRLLAVSAACAVVAFGGQLGALVSRWDFTGFTMVLLECALAAFIGVFGGFASGMIDPTRARRSAVWIWLRVPLLAFGVFGLLASIPGVVLLLLDGGRAPGKGVWEAVGTLLLAGAGVGLVAFFRFGGFNGLQHGVLRLLLVRSGVLPPRADKFFEHAAQRALMQKVGFGYRFIHALLLQHLAARLGGGAETADPAVEGPLESAGRRWLRRTAGLGLGAGLALLAWLGAASLSLELIAGKTWRADMLAPVLGALLLAFTLTIPVLLPAARWLGRRSWSGLAAGWLGLALILGWLARDEPGVPRPVTLAEVATVFPGAEQSYAVVTRHLTDGFGTDRSFDWGGFNFSQGPEQGQIWRDFLAARRSDLEANWEKLAPVRAWIDQLNSFDRIADLDADLLEMTRIRFQARVAYPQNAMALASLQAIDGQGDAALDILRPLLEAAGKLERGARGTDIYHGARQMQSVAIRAASFVLDNSRVSAGARARFADAVTASTGGPEGARRLYAIRYAAVEQASSSFGLAVVAWSFRGFDFLRRPLDLMGPVAFNRHATRNRWTALFADLAECAARREPANAEQRVAEFFAKEGQPRFKNIGGAWMTLSAWERLGLNSVTDQQRGYWTLEDQRAALLARLAQP